MTAPDQAEQWLVLGQASAFVFLVAGLPAVALHWRARQRGTCSCKTCTAKAHRDRVVDLRSSPEVARFDRLPVDADRQDLT